MRHLTAATTLPFLLLASLPAQAQMLTITPEQIGQIFCIGSLGNDMAPVEALLTPQLAATIADALTANAAYEIAHPGDKPPLGDGLPWRTWPDYAHGCTVGEVKIVPGMASVDIDYSFSSEPAANYTDTLLLMPVEIVEGLPPFWRIEDISLDQGLTFRTALEGAFEP